jgi:hypothetical protein
MSLREEAYWQRAAKLQDMKRDLPSRSSDAEDHEIAKELQALCKTLQHIVRSS